MGGSGDEGAGGSGACLVTAETTGFLVTLDRIEKCWFARSGWVGGTAHLVVGWTERSRRSEGSILLRSNAYMAKFGKFFARHVESKVAVFY